MKCWLKLPSIFIKLKRNFKCLFGGFFYTCLFANLKRWWTTKTFWKFSLFKNVFLNISKKNYSVVCQWWIIRKPTRHLQKLAAAVSLRFPDFSIIKKFKKKVLIKNLETPLETAAACFQRFPDNPSLTDHTVWILIWKRFEPTVTGRCRTRDTPAIPLA